MTAILGRMATYSGQEMTWDEALNSQVNESCPGIFLPGDAFGGAGPEALYPLPVPGVTKVV